MRPSRVADPTRHDPAVRRLRGARGAHRSHGMPVPGAGVGSVTYTATALPWWTLPRPTVDGQRVLTCHYLDPQHRAARVSGDCLVFCSVCRRRLDGHVWATLSRDVVLCGRCHKADHDDRADELRANAHDLSAEIVGQTFIDL